MTRDQESDLQVSLLELLVDGATVEEIESAAHDSEHAKNLALALHARFEERMRRERELSALLSATNELAAMTSLADLLQTIVERVRDLLSCDIAYFSLPDPEQGGFLIRAVSGAATGTVPGLHQPQDFGIAGMIARTGQPQWTFDYFTDDRFVRDEVVDRITRAEGLISLAGVPLLRGDRSNGALFVGSRTRRTFAPAEMSLLGSLAAHAAIAIDKATLLSELERGNRLLTDQATRDERAGQVHDRLMHLALRGGGLTAVASQITETLPGSAVICDADGKVIARSVEGRECQQVDPLENSVAHLLVEARDSRETVSDAGTWATPVYADGKHLGGIALTPSEGMHEGDLRLLERSALVIGLVLLFKQVAFDVESRVRGDLLADILAEAEPDAETVTARALNVGIELSSDHAVVAVVCEVNRTHASRGAEALALRHGGLSAQRDDHQVLLLPGMTPAQAAALVRVELAGTLSCRVTAGGAGPAADVPGIRSGYEEALRCVRALVTLGRVGQSADARELGLVGVLASNHRDLAGFVRTTVGPVLDYDARRGTDLARTLEVFYASGENLGVTGKQLHLHPKTVTQRLNRVAELLRSDPREAETGLEIRLALRAHMALAGHSVER